MKWIIKTCLGMVWWIVSSLFRTTKTALDYKYGIPVWSKSNTLRPLLRLAVIFVGSLVGAVSGYLAVKMACSLSIFTSVVTSGLPLGVIVTFHSGKIAGMTSAAVAVKVALEAVVAVRHTAVSVASFALATSTVVAAAWAAWAMGCTTKSRFVLASVLTAAVARTSVHWVVLMAATMSSGETDQAAAVGAGLASAAALAAGFGVRDLREDVTLIIALIAALTASTLLCATVVLVVAVLCSAVALCAGLAAGLGLGFLVRSKSSPVWPLCQRFTMIWTSNGNGGQMAKIECSTVSTLEKPVS